MPEPCHKCTTLESQLAAASARESALASVVGEYRRIMLALRLIVLEEFPAAARALGETDTRLVEQLALDGADTLLSLPLSAAIAREADRVRALERVAEAAMRTKRGIYTASKTKHATKWLALRAEGWPIVSTWIDEAGEGETTSFVDLWLRCEREASNAAALLFYCEEGEILKGAFVEAGCAMANGVPIFTVGPVPGSWKHHPLVTECGSLGEALEALRALTPRTPDAGATEEKP